MDFATSFALIAPELLLTGAATGSDATLYIGGWAYAGKKGTSKGVKIAAGVLIGSG